MAALFFIALLSAIFNYATWAAEHDSPDYYYAGRRNGWWALFWTAACIGSYLYLERFG